MGVSYESPMRHALNQACLNFGVRGSVRRHQTHRRWLVMTVALCILRALSVCRSEEKRRRLGLSVAREEKRMRRLVAFVFLPSDRRTGSSDIVGYVILGKYVPPYRRVWIACYVS